MKYQTFYPPEILKNHVRFFWLLECDDVGDTYIHRSFADGCVEIVFHYNTIFDEITNTNKRERSFTSGICGQSQRHRRFIADSSFGIFGAYLYPYAIPQLFGFSANDLSNQMVGFDDFLNREGREIEERIMTANNCSERIAILSLFLEQKLRLNRQDDSAICNSIRQIIHSSEICSVENLAKNANLSVRQFERKFKDYAGFSPKLYSRINRFQRTTKNFGGNILSLTDLAYDCGYYDQSHFIREFKEFSGYEPRRFFNGNGEGTQWR